MAAAPKALPEDVLAGVQNMTPERWAIYYNNPGTMPKTDVEWNQYYKRMNPGSIGRQERLTSGRANEADIASMQGLRNLFENWGKVPETPEWMKGLPFGMRTAVTDTKTGEVLGSFDQKDTPFAYTSGRGYYNAETGENISTEDYLKFGLAAAEEKRKKAAESAASPTPTSTPKVSTPAIGTQYFTAQAGPGGQVVNKANIYKGPNTYKF